MRLYLCGASAEADTVSSYMARMRAAGHTVTHDWTASVRSARARGVRDDELSIADMCALARGDLLGVLAADVVWLLVPEAQSVGAWVELGYALHCNVQTIVSGNWRRSIFAALATYDFDSHEAAAARLESPPWRRRP